MPDVVPSPNIWRSPATYEQENRAADPDGRLEAALRGLHDWAGADVVDVGCGSGYHLPQFAATARSVVGVEPHPPLLALAQRRVRGLPGVRVRPGRAQALPLADASVDVAHARWAYFFGPGCEPGLRELGRVLRRGGTALVVDNDASRSTFGSWFRRAHPGLDPAAHQRFWSLQGFTRLPVDMGWRFSRREDLEAVLRIEFAPELADALLREHTGLEVDYAVDVWWRRY